MTGLYATIAGLALLVAPVTSFGLLFDARSVPTCWIRLGGVLFALIGMQYLGTGLADAPSGQTGALSFYVSTIASRAFFVVSE